MIEHTQTLQLDECGGDYVNIETAKGYMVADAVNKVDARRLVACWNACVGMPTEHVEALAGVGTLADLRASQLASAHELLREALAVGLYATVVQLDGTRIMVRDRITAYIESLPRSAS